MNAWQPLLNREGTKVATLERLYLQNRDDDAFLPAVISSLIQLDEDVAWRGLWLVRRAAEDTRLTTDDLLRVADVADASRHWAWRLIMCQLLGTVQCPKAAREEVFPFLVDCFSDPRVIVRAWALSAMWLFRGDDEYRPKIMECMRRARRETGKAMQARVRCLMGAHRGALPS